MAAMSKTTKQNLAQHNRKEHTQILRNKAEW